MIEAFSIATAHRFGDALAAQHRLRHKLFIERQNWDIPSHDGLEYDQFDNPAATYLLWRDKSGAPRGVSRLVPTNRPYMIRDLWPDLLAAPHELPAAETVWEASRFGIDSDDPTLRAHIAAEIVAACQEFGLANGIERFLVVMPPLIVQRVIGGTGCPFEFLGPARRMGSYRVVAASVPVGEDVLRTVRARSGLTGSVLAPCRNPARRAA